MCLFAKINSRSLSKNVFGFDKNTLHALRGFALPELRVALPKRRREQLLASKCITVYQKLSWKLINFNDGVAERWIETSRNKNAFKNNNTREATKDSAESKPQLFCMLQSNENV